jgi:hypothetical protein
MMFNIGASVYSVAKTEVQASSGNLRTTGNITAYYSDERFKDKLGSIDEAVAKIMGLDAFYYKESALAKELGYDNDEQQIGLSAQELQKVLPEVVSLAAIDSVEDEEGNTVSKSGENYMTVDYAKIVPLLVAAIQEQQGQIDQLKEALEAK